jgi:hypothetical protein
MQKIILTFAIGMLLVIPSRSFAVEEKFFEYATDVGTPVDVPTGSIATQGFRVFNDHISAIDVWIDNTGVAGNATFSLLDGANTVLAAKIVPVPHADPFYAGQRLHVKFDRTINVNSGTWYTVTITSAAPHLRLYGIKRIQFVEHNAPYPIDYSIGASFLNGESQFAVYKFALYEEIDTTPPVIANASSSIAGPDAITVSFNANEAVDRSLSYGVIGSGAVSTIGFTGYYSVCSEGVYSCPMTFDVQRNAVYAYRLTVRDSRGNESYVDGTFESWRSASQPATDNQQPATNNPQPTTQGNQQQQPVAQSLVIANARVVAVSNAAAMIAWDTNRAANSLLTVSTDPVGGMPLKTIADGAYELTHTIATTDVLAANTSYYATIVSRDRDGSVAALVLPFGTLKKSATTTLPLPYDASAGQARSFVADDQASVSITWNALSGGGEPTGGYRIDVIDARGNLSRTMAVAPGTHTVTLPMLTGGEYHAVVYGDNNGVVEKIAEPIAVTVRKTAPPIDTYALIQKPVVYIPSTIFVMLVGGLYWYSRKQKNIEK